MRARDFTFVAVLVLASVRSWSAAPMPANSGAIPAPTPPARVPAGVILVKGAWSSASDSTTPVPETGTTTARDYHNNYFQLSYPYLTGWRQKFAGPPPSDHGYYVLSQAVPADEHMGSVLIEAQDMFFGSAQTGALLRADYKIERPPGDTTAAGRLFSRVDSVSPITELHRTVLTTEIRCHTVEFVFTSTDPNVIEQLMSGMQKLVIGAGAAPVCIKDYASGSNILSRVDPILADHRFNSIPVRVVIDTRGQVKFIHFISSFPEQARVITDALHQWRFKPYVSNGKAVEVETGIVFGVQLNTPKKTPRNSSTNVRS